MGQDVEFAASQKFVINIDNFGIVRAKEDCEGILPPSHDAMRISIASYTSPTEACAKGLVARIIYHDGDDPSADIGDSIYDTPYADDEFVEGNYFKGRTQKRGWYQMFDGEDLEDYVINIVQGKVVDKIRCDEISAGRKRVLTTQNPIQRRVTILNEGMPNEQTIMESEERLATRVCATLPAEVSFHNGIGDSPEIGDQIYQDGFTNSPLAPGYYALEGGFYIRVSNGGIISEKRLCSITICVDDIVGEQLTFAQNRATNEWTWRGIGGDTRDLPTVSATTPTLGNPGEIILNGAITSFGEFTELQYDWYYARSTGSEPTERQLIDQGILVPGGTATSVGAVTNVTVEDLQAFTTYYAMFVVTVGGTRITSDVLDVRLSRSNTPTVALAVNDATPDIGDTITLTTSVTADTGDQWTQTWWQTVDGTTTQITTTDTSAIGPFTGVDGDMDGGGVLSLTVQALANRQVTYFTRASFVGLNVDSNNVITTRNADEGRFGPFQSFGEDPIITAALTADPTLDDDFPTLTIDGLPTTVHTIVDNYGDGSHDGDHAENEVLSGEMFTQTATYQLPVYTDQSAERQRSECLSVDGCPSESLDMGQFRFMDVVTTIASVAAGAAMEATRDATGTSLANVYASPQTVDGTQEGGVTTWTLVSSNAYTPDPSTVPQGQSFTQTRNSNYRRDITAITQDEIHECISPDALDDSPGCTTAPAGQSGGTFNSDGDYTVPDVVQTAARSNTFTYTDAQADAAGVPDATQDQNSVRTATGTMPLPVDGTAAFGSITGSGSVHGGTINNYTFSGTPTVTTEVETDNTVRQVTETTTQEVVTANYVGAVQDGQRTCLQVTPPQHGGNPGTCGSFSIGQTQTLPDHFTGLTRTQVVTATASNGGITTREVNNPNYVIGTLTPSSLSWSSSQGDGTAMNLGYTIGANESVSCTLNHANFVDASATSLTGPTPSQGTIVLTRNRDTAHTGNATLNCTAPSGTSYDVASASLSAAAFVEPCTFAALSFNNASTTAGPGINTSNVLTGEQGASITATSSNTSAATVRDGSPQTLSFSAINFRVGGVAGATRGSTTIFTVSYADQPGCPSATFTHTVV